MDTSQFNLVDIGANLTSQRFRKDLFPVLRRSSDAGVRTIVITGTNVQASHNAIKLVQKYSNSKSGVRLYSTAGVHPHDASTFDPDTTYNELKSMVENHPDKIVAIGECGLDFNRDFSPRDKQAQAFQGQLELACSVQLPLFLHERDAHETFISILQPFITDGRLPPTVVHCFTGKEAHLLKYVSMGFYIGLTGCICMTSRGLPLRSIIKHIPLDKLLIETDAPFMYPYGGKGRCEPKDLTAVVMTLAECYNLSPAEIARRTTKNAERFFNFGHKGPSQVPKPMHVKEDPKQDIEDFEDKPVVVPVETNQRQFNGKLETIDGGKGEGGGQIVRIAFALAAILDKAVKVHSIRQSRGKPGLRSQHLASIELTAACAGMKVENAKLYSTEVSFNVNGDIISNVSANATTEDQKNELIAKSLTGGSISLMIQASLPVLIFGSPVSTLTPENTRLRLLGGTHVDFSPPLDAITIPFRQLLERFGVAVDIELLKPGFRASIGEVVVQSPRSPVLSMNKPLNCIDISSSSKVITTLYTRVTVYGDEASTSVGQSVVDSLTKVFSSEISSLKKEPTFDIVVFQTPSQSDESKSIDDDSRKPQRKKRSVPLHLSIQSVLETETGGLLSVNRTGILNIAKTAHEIAQCFKTYLDNGVCIDEHLADQAIIYMALAQGTSRLRIPSKRQSQHIETALDVVQRLTGAEYRIIERVKTSVVEIKGIGFHR